MDCFFSPESVAVIGASPNRFKGGNAIIRNVIQGYRGPIYPINPNYEEIEGLKCFPRVSDIQKPVDLVSIFISAAFVPEALRDCGAAGVKGAIIQSGGFAETGEQGRILQEECLAIAKEEGIRIWGPNCMGLMDARKGFVCTFLTPELWADGLTPGEVALITQSGTLAGAFIIDLMSHGIMGVSKACSIGNKIDVDEIELLEYLIEDPDTAVIAMFLESIPKGRRFLEIAARSSKPLVVLKGGRSAKGAMAAMSHTASLSGDDRIIREALTQSGVILTDDFHQMMDISRALSMVPKGIEHNGIAVLTFSGGAGIVSADLLDRYGLDLADLSKNTTSQLSAFFPAWAPVSNPVDLWPSVEKLGGAEAYLRAVEIVLEDEGISALLLLSFTGGFNLDLDLATIGAMSRKKGKPVFFWIIGPQDQVETFQQEAKKHGMFAYREISQAARAIHALYARADGKSPVEVDTVRTPSSEGESLSLEPVLETIASTQGVLDEFDSKKVLAAAGIPTVPEKIATDCEQALDIAQEFGFPVVLKGLLPGEVHKTEKGLIKLDLRNPAELSSAFDELVDQLGGLGSILIQKYLKPDLEFICGMVRDPDFGPSVMFGMGGVMAEVYEDVVFRIAPLSEQVSLEMMNSIRAKEVLAGFRGRQPVQRNDLASVLMGLGRIGVEVSQVSQIDINPLALVDGKLMALDATVIVDGS